MSYEIIKSISVNFDKQTISVTSASNNVSPRIYESWDPLASGTHTFEGWLRALAVDLFGGSAKFLPSCTSKAHQAYFVASNALGVETGWCGVATDLDYRSEERADLFEKWYDKFLAFLKDGRVHKERYLATTKVGDRKVSVNIRQRPHGDYIGNYRCTEHPKPVSWLHKQYIDAHFPGYFNLAEI